MPNPITFFSHSTANSNIKQAWTSIASERNVLTDIPKEFEGEGLGFSPEDYFALALQNCFIATFKVIAHKSKLDFENISVKFSLMLGPGETQSTMMKEALFFVQLTGCSNQERAQRILEKTTKSCMILNSVKTNLTFEFHFL